MTDSNFSPKNIGRYMKTVYRNKNHWRTGLKSLKDLRNAQKLYTFMGRIQKKIGNRYQIAICLRLVISKDKIIKVIGNIKEEDKIEGINLLLFKAFSPSGELTNPGPYLVNSFEDDLYKQLAYFQGGRKRDQVFLNIIYVLDKDNDLFQRYLQESSLIINSVPSIDSWEGSPLLLKTLKEEEITEVFLSLLAIPKGKYRARWYKIALFDKEGSRVIGEVIFRALFSFYLHSELKNSVEDLRSLGVNIELTAPSLSKAFR